VAVSNTPDPPALPEEGGTFTHTVTVTNIGPVPVRIVSLVDSVAGDLTARPASTCVTVPNAVLAPGQSYTCTFTLDLLGEAGASRSNTVRVTVIDSGARVATAEATATVTLLDVPPRVEVAVSVAPRSLPEPGGSFTYTVAVTNTSNPETVTVVSLRSDTHGDLNRRGTCRTGVVLPPGATFTCSFTSTFTGNAGHAQATRVTVTVRDNEGTTATATSDAEGGTIVITDVPPSVRVTKTAHPAPTHAPPDTFVFLIAVTNTSGERVTLESLVDDVFGDLAGRGTCARGVGIDPGATYRCSFSAAVPGGRHANVVTATVVDDDGSRATGSATAITDVVALATVVPTLILGPQPAGARATVAFTGAAVEGPARVATALVLAGMVMLGLTRRRLAAPLASRG
jgi:uncharacterized repeat protein (TIGR01451 family)